MNEISKFIITWILLLIYMGFVLGYLIEIFTIESPTTKVWVKRGIVPILLIAPSIIMAYLTRSNVDSRRTEQM